MYLEIRLFDVGRRGIFAYSQYLVGRLVRGKCAANAKGKTPLEGRHGAEGHNDGSSTFGVSPGETLVDLPFGQLPCSGKSAQEMPQNVYQLLSSYNVRQLDTETRQMLENVLSTVPSIFPKRVAATAMCAVQ